MILTACLVVVMTAHYVGAADEIDQMLNVEGSAQKAGVKQDTVKAAVPATPVTQVLPVKAATSQPAIAQVPAARPAVRATAPVQAKPAVVPQQQIAAQTPEPAVTPAIAPDLALLSLRAELKQREQELVKANREIDRLKDIVRKIQEASKRESLVFHYNIAAIYRASMMYKKAEEEYLKALAMDPKDAGVHYNMAILYDDNFKDKKKAKLHYEKFLELAPEDPDAPKVREWLSSLML